jgi:hypothetical protein
MLSSPKRVPFPFGCSMKSPPDVVEFVGVVGGDGRSASVRILKIT